MMKIDDIMNEIKKLGGSQGTYGRLYEDLVQLKKWDPEAFKVYSETLEKEQFETVLDIVLYFEEGVSPRKSREPKKKIWKLPVTWEMYGFVEVEGDSIDEAIKKFHEIEDGLPLPTDADYVDSSFRLSDDDDDEENLKGLIAIMNKENLDKEV